MRKIASVTTGILSSLFFAFPVFAQTPGTVIELCPRGFVFEPLCRLNDASLPNVVRAILILLFTAAVIIALIFLIYGGIKWILSGGDKSAVESARNHIVAAIVGLVIAFAAFFIINIVAKVFNVNILDIRLPTL